MVSVRSHGPGEQLLSLEGLPPPLAGLQQGPRGTGDLGSDGASRAKQRAAALPLLLLQESLEVRIFLNQGVGHPFINWSLLCELSNLKGDRLN